MLERRPSQEIRWGLSIMRKKKQKPARDQNENRGGKMEQEGGD